MSVTKNPWFKAFCCAVAFVFTVTSIPGELFAAKKGKKLATQRGRFIEKEAVLAKKRELGKTELEARKGVRQFEATVPGKGYHHGLFLSPYGGSGNADKNKQEMQVVVPPSGAASLIVSLQGLTYDTPRSKGVKLTLVSPEGKAIGRVKGRMERGGVREPPRMENRVLAKKLEQLVGEARRQEADARQEPPSLPLTETEMKKRYGFSMDAMELRAMRDHLDNLRKTPNAGVLLASEKEDEDGLISAIILNPQPGTWTVRVVARGNADPFQASVLLTPMQRIKISELNTAGMTDELQKAFPEFAYWFTCDDCCICQAIIAGIVAGVYAAIVFGQFWALGIAVVAIIAFVASVIGAEIAPDNVADIILGLITFTIGRLVCDYWLHYC